MALQFEPGPARSCAATRPVRTAATLPNLGSMTDFFSRFSASVAAGVGTYRAFMAALGVVVLWAVTGPLFHFSDSWQLVINTGTTVVTFIMVFVIQATQNRETRAIHLKLDELIRSQQKARNIFADLEHATDRELEELEAEFRKIRARAGARQQARAARTQ